MFYNYPSFVDVNKINEYQGNEGQYRYYLSIPFFNADTPNTLLIVLKNPSTADKIMADDTALQVCNYAYKQNFSKVILVNLFAYKATDSMELKNLCKLHGLNHIVGLENDKYIKQAIQEANKIIVAWGTPPKGFVTTYKTRIKKVHTLLKKHNLYYANKLSKKVYPLHAIIWNKTINLKDYRNDCLLYK
ncbi:MAG: hypothetical protein H6Q74_2526 [Firmicutes bacterium]|nr:hypothetical protein [Bacillota bacterium]